MRAAPDRADRTTNELLPKTCPIFRDDRSIRYDARSSKLKSMDRVSLSTMHGRVVAQFVLSDRQRSCLYDRRWKIGGAELIRRENVWYLHITQTKADPAPDEPTGYIGVDFGIVNLATDSDGHTASGSAVERVRRWYAGRRRALQRVNTKSAKRGLKKLARRQARFQRDTNHRISKRLVGTAKYTGRGIALEDLTGIRDRIKVRDADQRARHSNWGFAQLAQFVCYKAQRAGVAVSFVDPASTSQRCSACGHTERKNRKRQAHFCCVVCQFASPADYNAAINIQRAAVKQPLVSSRESSTLD